MPSFAQQLIARFGWHTAYAILGAAVLIGRVGIGYLLDRVFAPRLTAICFIGTAFGIGLLWLGSTKMAFVGAFLVGFGLGAEVDVIPYLTGRYFGLRAFGKIYSSAFAAFARAGASRHGCQFRSDWFLSCRSDDISCRHIDCVRSDGPLGMVPLSCRATNRQ